MNLVACLVTVLLASSLAESSRILAFLPYPAKSHQRVIQPLLRELCERGHHVISVTPFPLEDPPQNYTAIHVPDFTQKMLGQFAEEKGDMKEFFMKLKSPIAKVMGVFWRLMSTKVIEWTMESENVRRLIDSDLEFDLVILETTFLQEPFIALGHRFKAPVVEFMPAGNIHWSYWLHGNPVDTSYIMDSMLPYTDRMTFQQRVFNTFISVWSRFVCLNLVAPKLQTLMDQHFRYSGWESRPPMLEMIADTSLVLVNTHFSVNYPFPSAPHVKEVGGLNIANPKPLPKDLQDYMDGAEDGVIYFTLGSHLQVSKILGEELRVVFSQVFAELKQRVLWKWETEFPDPPPNVRIGKWFPQQDILAHKKCVLFITHGGMLSLTEAVDQGVPTIGIPIMPDQDKNVVHMERFEYGLQLQPDNITYQSLQWAIQQVLGNPKYRENAKKRSELFRDKPETALETAVYWTEYVIRHRGAPHLKPSVATMPWYQQAMLDVYTAIALILLIPLYIAYKITKCVCCCLCKTKNKVKTKKE